MASVKVDPFKISPPQQDGKAVPFEDLLSQIYSMPSSRKVNPSRWWKWGEDSIFMDRLTRWHGCLVGTVYRMRMSNIEYLGTDNGTEPIPLETDQGTGHHVAFLWDATRRVLWFQRDRTTIGINTFAQYVCGVTNAAFTHKAVFHLDSVEAVKKMKSVRSIHLKLGDSFDVDGFDVETADKGMLWRFMKLRKDLGAAKIEVIIKPERTQSLNNEAKNLAVAAADLVEDGDKSVLKAKIGIGPSDDAEEEERLVDLLRDRIHFSDGVSDSKFVDPADLIAAVKRVYQHHFGEVEP